MEKNIFKTVGMVLLGGAMLVTLSACEQKGPAQKAGESLDNAVENAGQKMEEAGDSIRDATKRGN
jgi:predicted small lipoprotein YifL